MDKYIVNLTNEAFEDLKSIYNYIAITNSDSLNAAKVIKAIRNEINKLTTFPLRYPVFEFHPWDKVGLRYINIKSYLVLYLTDETNQVVNVLRIFHSKQDITKSFKT